MYCLKPLRGDIAANRIMKTGISRSVKQMRLIISISFGHYLNCGRNNTLKGASLFSTLSLCTNHSRQSNLSHKDALNVSSTTWKFLSLTQRKNFWYRWDTDKWASCALQSLDWTLLPRACLGVVALLCGNGYIVGINQIYDVEIDAVNKPFLPVAAGLALPKRLSKDLPYKRACKLKCWSLVPLRTTPAILGHPFLGRRRHNDLV